MVPTWKSSSTSRGALGLRLILIRALEGGVGIVRRNDYIYYGAVNERRVNSKQALYLDVRCCVVDTDYSSRFVQANMGCVTLFHVSNPLPHNLLDALVTSPRPPPPHHHHHLPPPTTIPPPLPPSPPHHHPPSSPAPLPPATHPRTCQRSRGRR